MSEAQGIVFSTTVADLDDRGHRRHQILTKPHLQPAYKWVADLGERATRSASNEIDVGQEAGGRELNGLRQFAKMTKRVGKSPPQYAEE
jgi:hypothetical protein